MAFRCIHINHIWCHYCAANQRIAIPLTQVFEYADIFITNRIIEYNLQEFQQKGSTTNWNCSIWQHQKYLEENQEPTISSTSNYPIRSRLHQQHLLCFLYENCSSWISLDSMTHQTSLTHPQFQKFKTDWHVFKHIKHITNIPDNKILAQLYNCCGNHIQNSLIIFFTLIKDTCYHCRHHSSSS